MFKRSGSQMLLVAITGLFVNGAVALADLPADQVVTFSLYNTPGQSSSGVKWTLAFSVHAQARIGDLVKWKVTNLRITEHMTEGDDRVWVRMNPNVETLNGLWAVVHDDPMNPSADDLWVMPLVTGVGMAQGTGYANLSFTFSAVGGETFIPLINFVFQLVGGGTEDSGVLDRGETMVQQNNA